MPRVKWIGQTKEAPPPLPDGNGVKELFQRAMKVRGMSYQMLGERLGQTESALRSRMFRGAWDNRELRAWAEALEIDAATLGRAVLYR